MASASGPDGRWEGKEWEHPGAFEFKPLGMKHVDRAAVCRNGLSTSSKTSHFSNTTVHVANCSFIV